MAELSTGAAPRLITTGQAAELLQVSQRTILNWIERDAIPYLKLPSAGGSPRYRIPLQGFLSSLAGTYDLEQDLNRLVDSVDEDLDGETLEETLSKRRRSSGA